MGWLLKVAKRIPFKGYDLTKDAFGEPQDFYGIKVYPFLVKDYELIHKTSLLYLNNKIEKERLLRDMSLLKYMLFTGKMGKSRVVTDSLKEILEKVFQQEIQFQFSLTRDSERLDYEDDFTTLIYFNQYVKEDELLKLVGMLKFYIYLPKDDKTIYESMFKRLKDLILFQNYLPADDFRVSSKRAYDTLESTRASRLRKYQGRGIFQDMVLYKIITHENLDYVKKNVTWKNFKATIDRFGKIIDFTTIKPLEMSGQIEYKNKKYKTDNWSDYIKPYSYYSGVIQSANDTLGKLKKLT